MPLAAAALLFVGSLGMAGTASAATPYSTDTPMILASVLPADMAANRYGVCTSHFSHVIRNQGAGSAIGYLDAAQACGLKVILYFSQTISAGTVYPSRVAPLVDAVKNHPALFGYLSVKEPSWVGVSGAEIRTMYQAFHAADPNHPVIALFGDVPHFGATVNPYTAGMADIVMLDWYPVETANGGRSLTGTSYVGGAYTFFNRIRVMVASKTPGTPIWLMVQTFKYLAPTYHKKQRPSQALLYREVREGFVYLHAGGIAFQTWTNTSYNVDERRDPTMVSWMRTLTAQIHGGTFQ